MYGLSNGESIFDLWRPSKVKVQGQIKKALKLNILKTVRDRENVNRSYIGSYVWAFVWRKYFRSHVTSKGQRSGSNPKISMIVR